MIEQIKENDVISVDVETTSESHKKGDNIHFRRCTLVIIGIGSKYGSEAFIAPRWPSELLSVLQNPNIRKVAHNAKFDWKVLRYNGINVQGLWMDTLVGYKLINENDPADLGSIAERELGIVAKYGYPKHSKKLEKRFGRKYLEARAKRLINHCKEDVEMTYKLAQWEYKELNQVVAE